MNNKKVALVTGASSGIGYETAVALHKAGFEVYGAARRLEKMEDLKAQGISILSLDVTDDDSMQKCVAEIAEKEGRIDVLVNNAGYGSFGAVEDVPMSEARRQIEVNIFGLARMTQLVLPYMREQKSGKIVNISSMGGKIWTPFGAWYHATKFAVEGFSDCLRLEVKQFGIDVILIEPGGIKTDWGIIAADNLVKSSSNGVYAQAAKEGAEGLKKMYSGNGLTPATTIANCIAKAVQKKKPKTRYLLGYMAKPAVFMKNVFGDKLYDKIIMKMF
ncbi:MAG: oxidoreductase [Streptococcaceae bacterium]|nr:oxidoreductase [Streptococcaceae bacterium]MCL2681001.1 oxidoreductase [Streptococcaceae bacterium]MCL2858893.1 oxidoreductase [Streptococcaceae bacterium]